MKKLSFILALVIALTGMIGLFATPVYAAVYTGYIYDPDTNTYTVYTADGLIEVASIINGDGTKASGNDFANIVIANDIDMSEATSSWTPIGDKSFRLYQGTVDGQGHTIKNFTDIAAGKHRRAFIGRAGGCTVKNLTFVDPVVEGGKNIGIIIGDIRNEGNYPLTADDTATIENCHIINGQVTSNNSYVGAVVGNNETLCNLVVKNCTVDAKVSSTHQTNSQVGIVFGGEQSKNATYRFENIVVTGEVEGASNSGAFGYMCDVDVTMTNVVSFVTATGTQNTTCTSSLMANAKRCNVTMNNVVCKGAPIGSADVLGANAANTFVINNVSVVGAEDKLFKAVAVDGTNDVALTVDGVPVEATTEAFAAVTVPAITEAAANAYKDQRTALIVANGGTAIIASSAQLLNRTTDASEKTSVRLVLILAADDISAIDQVGVKVTVNDVTAKGFTNKVYTSVNAAGIKYDALAGTYYVLVELQNIPNALFGATFTVTPYVDDAAGTAATFTVNSFLK